MSDILKMLDGYKTYIAAIGFGLTAWYYYQQGDMGSAYQSAAMALGLVGLRSALAKLTPVAEAKPPVESPKPVA